MATTVMTSADWIENGTLIGVRSSSGTGCIHIWRATLA